MQLSAGWPVQDGASTQVVHLPLSGKKKKPSSYEALKAFRKQKRTKNERVIGKEMFIFSSSEGFTNNGAFKKKKLSDQTT